VGTVEGLRVKGFCVFSSNYSSYNAIGLQLSKSSFFKFDGLNACHPLHSTGARALTQPLIM